MIVIEDGTLIDRTGRPPRTGTTILIEENRIREIGRPEGITAPGGAHIIQASGKFIIPGLIDAHIHYRYPWIHRLYLANGVTTVRDMGGQIERVLTLRQELGTVKTGKYADLVILDANPLEDIRNTKTIHRVINDGRVLDPAVLLERNIRQFGERGKEQ